MITLDDIQSNEEIASLILEANNVLAEIGYTEHGQRHVGYVSSTASSILRKLDYPERTVELAAIAGWVHDVGNVVNRKHHGLNGAMLLFPLLRDMGMDMGEICCIMSATGYHEEETGVPVSEVSAALIIADKSDAHRTRVRKGKYDPYDIHDRVNYSIKKNWIDVDPVKRVIRYEMVMDDSSSVMEFMQIFLTRMRLCEKAAEYLECRLDIVVNGITINNQKNGKDAQPVI
jgi:metal-dependent HD superfamily phosphatase/phosphodiesterase